MSNIIPLLRSTLLLVCFEVDELIRKDLYLALECTRLRKLLDECGASRHRHQIFLTFVF